MSSVHPAFVLMLAGAVLPALPHGMRRIAAVAAGLGAVFCVANIERGARDVVQLMNWELVLVDADALSIVFGWIFVLTILIWTVYSWRLRSRLEIGSAFLYGAGALGAVFAGDLLTLFLFWELMAVASTGVVLAGGTVRARRAAFRYFLQHAAGGVFLLAGIVLHASSSGSMAFGAMELSGAGPWLIFLGFAVNAAIPPVSGWLPDAYPESSPTGSVFLSAFTTKTSVYVLATAFAGEPLLIGLGAFMSLYGIFYALNENDARRVLSYSIMNQVGFMICGVGIGTELAINGVAAHAFCHILYKSLLFMSAGAVMYRTGKTKCTELGGLWRSMPWTFVFGTIGALSISALPLTNGFISKPMIVDAAAHGVHGTNAGLLTFAYLALLIASAGVSLHAGIKFPWFVFFAKDRGLRPKEAPKSMLLAMGVVSALCIGLGVYPDPLYRLLPYSVEGFHAYEASHVVLQLQLLIASGFAFFWLLPVLKRTDTVTLDVDWPLRRFGRSFVRFVDGPLMRFFGGLSRAAHEHVPRALWHAAKNPAGMMRIGYDRLRLAAAAFGSAEQFERRRQVLRYDQARYEATPPGTPWPIGTVVLYAAVLFLAVLLAYLF